VVFEENQILGVVGFNNIDKIHQKSDWAFYLDKLDIIGLGAILELYIIDYAFNEMGIEKLNCEVLESNLSVVKMHKKFGFIEEGFRHSNIIKKDTRIGVFFLGLTKQD